MRPYLLFDKSFLQSLAVDEAVILDQMFSSVISPLFFAETMADLAKDDGSERRTGLGIIRNLAERTPVCHSYMNAFHGRLLMDELLGEAMPLDHRPSVAGGRPVQMEGKNGVVFKKSVEVEAFERWQNGRFLDVERIAAVAWRAALGNLDLPGIASAFKSMLSKEARPKNHQQAYSLAREIVDAPGHNYKTLIIAHRLLGLPEASLPQVIKIWKSLGSRSFREHAPYAAHCLEVDLYFCLALSNGIISDQRASNRIDIGYLYYLPFTKIFVSGDKLHRASAPLFMKADQKFVWGPDLKKDLAELNDAFMSFPEKEKAKGLFVLAKNPPIDHQGACAKLWDVFAPRWREPRAPVPEIPPEKRDELIRSSKRFSAAAGSGPPASWPLHFAPKEVDHLIIERAIPRERGSWRMFSVEVEAAEDQAAAEGRDPLF